MPFEIDDGINQLFNYASNNPIGRLDPTGEFDWYKFVACFTGLSASEINGLKGGISDDILNDPKVAKELSKEIKDMKTKNGPGWKKVRKKLIKKAKKKAIEKAVKKMGQKAFLKWLGGFVAGKAIPIFGQASLAWDACKASYCAAVAW